MYLKLRLVMGWRGGWALAVVLPDKGFCVPHLSCRCTGERGVTSKRCRAVVYLKLSLVMGGGPWLLSYLTRGSVFPTMRAGVPAREG